MAAAGAPPAEKKERLQKGPAFGKVAKPQPSDDNPQSAWPTYRHDNQRSGATAAGVSPDPDLLWERRVEDQETTNPRLSEEWRYNNWIVTDPLTAPVIAGGRVYVGAVNSHRLFALDAKTGKTLWTFIAGGRLDMPPAIFGGLCLFGARDGWVYCLRAENGELAWRFQAAPQDHRIMAFGQLESPSPVVGGVTVQNDAAYFGAGRTGFVDSSFTGYALDLWNGEILETLNGGPKFTWPEIMVSDGTAVFLGNSQSFAFKKKGSSSTEKLPFLKVAGGGGDFFPIGVVARFWRYPGISRDNTARRTGGLQEYRGGVGRIVIGASGPQKRVFLFGRETGGPGARNENIYKEFCAFEAMDGKRNQKTEPVPLWFYTLPEPLQIEAMILAGETIFAAGPTDRFQRKEGFLWAISAEDGKKVKEIKLAAPPTGEGMAAAYGRLYVSTQDGKLLCFGKK